MSPKYLFLSAIFIVTSLCNTNTEDTLVSNSNGKNEEMNNQESERPLIEDETDKTQEIQKLEPKRDDYGIWQLSDDQFDPFLELHDTVAVLFTRSDDLYSYAGKYHFDRAAHILRDLRNSSTQFAVIEGDRSKSSIHDEFGIESYPTIKYCHHDYLSPKLNKNNNKNNISMIIEKENEEWEIRCLDFNHHIIELMVVRWVEGLNSQCSIIIDDIKQFENVKNDNQVLFVGFFDSFNDIEFKLYEDLCKQYKWERDIWSYQPTFAVVINKEFGKTLSEKVPNLIVYCEFKGN